MSRLLTAIAGTVLLSSALAATAAETGAPAAVAPPPVAPSGDSRSTTAAQQAVLERIRRMRDGDLRRFGSCSYRWDRWKLQPDGTRTTTYSCDANQISDHTIGVNCSKLQINSYIPGSGSASTGSKSGRSGTWGSWRLPQAGGEELMVATLCANAIAQPEAPASAPAPATPPRPAPATDH